MPGVFIKEDEPFENALRRFKKQVQKSGSSHGDQKAPCVPEAEREEKEKGYGRTKTAFEETEKNATPIRAVHCCTEMQSRTIGPRL